MIATRKAAGKGSAAKRYARIARVKIQAAITGTRHKPSADERAVQRQVTLLLASRFFDCEWFRRHNDVDASVSDHDMVAEYVRDRDFWSRPPSYLFNPSFYLERNADVRVAQVHPLVHFVKFGLREGRSFHPLVDLVYLQKQNGTTGGIVDKNSLEMLIRRFDPHVLFENEYFLRQVELRGYRLDDRSGLQRFLEDFESENVDPTPYFCGIEYLKGYPDVAAAGLNPLLHFVWWGDREGRHKYGARYDRAFSRGVLSPTRRDAISDATTFSDYLIKYKIEGLPPSPTGYSPHLKTGNELLRHSSEPFAVGVGAVLYETSSEQLDHLLQSISHQAKCISAQGSTVRTWLAVNDPHNTERYSELAKGAGCALIVNEGNIGFGRAHNKLMNEAFADSEIQHYYGVNPDGYLMRQSLSRLASFARATEGKALIEARQFPIEHPKWFDPVSLATAWVSGAAFFVSRTIFECVGGFDEDFDLYCEDVDWSWRVREAGFATLVCPTARFFHDVVPRQGRSDPQRQAKMLLGARLLAWKWGNDEFVKKMEQELVGSRLVARRELAVLANIARRPGPHLICDFENHLRFARSRFW